MSKQTKGGNGNVLLLAGLGLGAFMLFANKSRAQTNASFTEMPAGNGDDVPDAPKILAVNNSSTESPLPTGIVSDEDGMETTSTSSPTHQSAAPRVSAPSYDFDDSDDLPGGTSTARTVANAAVSVLKNAQATARNTGKVPPLISTKLTPKETEIINAGKLTASLALKRPDLYKAAYVKKLGGNTTAGKKKALNAATLAINAAVNAAQAAKTGGLSKAAKYPAKPAHTFVQTAGGMASQTAIAKIAALQKTGVKVSPAAQKVAASVKAAKASKTKTPVKKSRPVSAKPAKKAVPKKAARPAKKAATKKRR